MVQTDETDKPFLSKLCVSVELWKIKWKRQEMVDSKLIIYKNIKDLISNNIKEAYYGI